MSKFTIGQVVKNRSAGSELFYIADDERPDANYLHNDLSRSKSTTTVNATFFEGLLGLKKMPEDKRENYPGLYDTRQEAEEVLARYEAQQLNKEVKFSSIDTSRFYSKGGC